MGFPELTTLLYGEVCVREDLSPKQEFRLARAVVFNLTGVTSPYRK